jgi:hypothetical protein
MDGWHRAQAVAMATGPALALSWTRDDLAEWTALWAAWKKRERGSVMEGLAGPG